jgi:DNA modification methylase
VDCVITDPPYGLSFMGKGWDHGVPGKEYWTAIKSAIKPGAHLVAFGGTRTYHRLVCAIEDAGFEIRDCVMWIYGSGFPKSHNISKSIDKRAGVEREVIGSHTKAGDITGGRLHAGSNERGIVTRIDITTPATEAAKQWDGWGTALKPAVELICLARKPISEKTVAANVLKYGTGALNIDECRITSSGEILGRKSKTSFGLLHGDNPRSKPMEASEHPKGRWPANVIHDGSDEVIEGFPESKDGIAVRRNGNQGRGTFPVKIQKGSKDSGYGGQGSASRFFYTAKASKADRGPNNTHPTVKPTALMKYLIKLINPPGGVILDPFMGSGSTLKAAQDMGQKAIGIEKESEYCEIATKRLAQEVFDFGSEGNRFQNPS